VPDYAVKFEDLEIGGAPYHVRSLLDRQQFSDPDGVAAALGICSTSWPLFGLLWPAGCVLAEQMSHIDFAGRRVLEIGCGLGLASLVAQARGADVTASDHHPLADSFLRANAALNHLPPIRFHRGDWQVADEALGRFDLIIGSDVLYDRALPIPLAGFIERHAARLFRGDRGRPRPRPAGAVRQAHGRPRVPPLGRPRRPPRDRGRVVQGPDPHVLARAARDRDRDRERDRGNAGRVASSADDGGPAAAGPARRTVPPGARARRLCGLVDQRREKLDSVR
jgi:SAM-dependent methyltransferase